MGIRPRHESGTGPVLENLLLTEDLGDIILIVLDLFPVGRLGFPALLPGRLGRPRLPVMPGIDMVRFLASQSAGSGILLEAFAVTGVSLAFPLDIIEVLCCRGLGMYCVSGYTFGKGECGPEKESCIPTTLLLPSSSFSSSSLNPKIIIISPFFLPPSPLNIII